MRRITEEVRRLKSPFTGAPYGTYQGAHGSADQWRRAFGEAMGKPEAEELMRDDSPWGVLGLKAGASPAEIKKAYRAALQVHHPDHGGDTETARRIIAAYTILMGG